MCLFVCESLSVVYCVVVEMMMWAFLKMSVVVSHDLCFLCCYLNVILISHVFKIELVIKPVRLLSHDSSSNWNVLRYVCMYQPSCIGFLK